MAGALTGALFIAGAHTDIGKTHVACALLHAAIARGLTVDAFKPVVSGFDPDEPAGSDPARLLAALGKAATPEAVAAMSPWRFTAPLAPPMAARLEGRSLGLDELTQAGRGWLARTDADLRLIEGVGGLMSPIAEAATGLDLMLALELPAILVGGAYLGGMSHTLTALEVLRARALEVRAVVVSQPPDADAPDFAESVAMVRSFAGSVPVLAAPRGAPGGWAEALLDLAVGSEPVA